MDAHTESGMLLKIAEFACAEGPSYATVDGKDLLRETELSRPDFIAMIRRLERRGFVRVHEAMGDLGGIAAVDLLAPAREWLHTVRKDVPSPKADGSDLQTIIPEGSSISIDEIADAKGWGIQRVVDAVEWLCARGIAKRVRKPANIGQHQIARIS